MVFSGRWTGSLLRIPRIKPINETGWQADLYYGTTEGHTANVNFSESVNEFSGNRYLYEEQFIELNYFLTDHTNIKAFFDHSYKTLFAIHWSISLDQSGIVRYRGAGVKTSSIQSWINNLLATGVEENKQVPRSSQLYQNYPNPFNPVTNIRFELAESQQVTLQIFNIEGRLVKTLIDNQLFAGSHELSWNGLDNHSQPAASGAYYYILKAGDFQSAKRMVLMR
jgi:hypothetical protein